MVPFLSRLVSVMRYFISTVSITVTSILNLHMSLCVKKKPQQFGFPTRHDTNRPVQSQKQARSLKINIKEEVELFIRLAKTKALISLAVTAKLVCAFDFAYANKLIYTHGNKLRNTLSSWKIFEKIHFPIFWRY